MRPALAIGVTVDLSTGAVQLPSRAINNEYAAPVPVTVNCRNWRLRRVRVILPVDAELAVRLRRWSRLRLALLAMALLMLAAGTTGLVSVAADVQYPARTIISLANAVIGFAFVAVCWRFITTRPAQWPEPTTPGHILIHGVAPDVAREWEAANPPGVIRRL